MWFGQSPVKPIERIIEGGSTSRKDGPCEIRVCGLTPEEFEIFRSSLVGASWIRVRDGRLESVAVFQPLPDPSLDLMMTPHWAGDREHDLLGEVDLTRIRNVKEFDKLSNCSASIIVKSITAGFTDSNERRNRYMDAAGKLESFGFECMRSRRGRDGKFWEIWYLPGLWMADGALKKAIEPFKPSGVAAEVKGAVHFLCNCGVPWGILDVCCQRAAITFD